MTEDWVALLRKDLSDLSEVFSAGPSSSLPALLPGERRNVAILFLDLEGFTAISGQLDHELVHKIGSSVMNALSRVVEFHGGNVDKYEGVRIMALFGAERAHENDCVRAVSSALRMMDAVKELGGVLRNQGYELDASAGISYGDVTVAPDPSGHLTATGDEVNVASRMEETAAVGTVQVTKAVRRECGDRFTWDDLGSVSVKGRKRPIHAFRPTGPGREQIQRWERAADLVKVPFVGRIEELRFLSGQLLATETKARNRRGGAIHRAVGVLGEAGIGKSRLVHEFAKSLASLGGRTLLLKAGCASYAQPPLWLPLSLLRTWLGHGREGLPPALDEKPELSGLLPAMKEEAVAQLDSLLTRSEAGSHPVLFSGEEEGRSGLYSAIAEFFRTLAVGSDRVVVVLDDIQWVDSASREAIEFVLTNCDTDHPLVFLLIYRPEPVAGSEMARALPEGYVTFQELELGEIDEKSSRDLIGHLLGVEGPGSTPEYEEMASFLVEASGRNAFFLEELVLSMVETGQLERDKAGSWRLGANPEDLKVPGSIKGVIRARVDQLSEGCRLVLQVASVLGEEFGTEALTEVADRVGREVEAGNALEELRRRGLLLPVGEDPAQGRFEHVLVRDAVYETILRHNRSLLHSLCAEVLAEREKDDEYLADAIARHWADAGDTAEAVVWGRKALDLAAKRYDADSVMAWSDRLEGWTRSDLRTNDDAAFLAGIMLARQEAEGRTLSHEERSATLRRLEGLISEWELGGLRSGVTMAWGDHFLRTERISEALDSFELALSRFEADGDVPGTARALSSIAICHRSLGDLVIAAEKLEKGVELLRGLDERALLAGALHWLAVVRQAQGKMDSALALEDEALTLAREAGNRLLEGNILGLTGVTMKMQGRREPALAHLRQALELSRETGNRSGELVMLNNMCTLLRTMNRLEESHRYGLEALEAARELGHRRSEANVLCSLGVLERRAGRSEEALSFYERSLEIHRELGNRQNEAIVLGNMGNAYADLGQVRKAIEYYLESAEVHRDVGNHWVLATVLGTVTLRFFDLGEMEAALPYLEESKRLTAETGNPRGVMLTNLASGDVAFAEGRFRDAIELYRSTNEAAADHSESGEISRALLGIGRSLLALGEVDEGEAHLHEAIAISDTGRYCEAHLTLAELHEARGDIEQARGCIRTALEKAILWGCEDLVEKIRSAGRDIGLPEAGD